jgi:hypothetical protein
MKFRSTRFRLTRMILVAAPLLFAGLAAPQTPGTITPKPGALSDQVFKNVQVLKGISVDDFMGTMGLMSAGIGFDCSECHEGAGTEKVDWAADNPKKVTARRMVTMVNTINKSNFGGRATVSCWTCHRGRDRPAFTEALETVYGPGPEQLDDMLTQAPRQPQPNAILDKYLDAMGGTAKLAAIRSFVATGTSIGFGGLGGGADVHIYAKAPDSRTTLIQFTSSKGRGDSVRSFNGKTAWVKTPLAVLTEYQATGGEMDGARIDAQIAFPGQIKDMLKDYRVSFPTTISDLPGPESQTTSVPGQPKQVSPGIGQDREVNMVQGTGPNGSLVNLYFDKESGLLVRMVRLTRTSIGRVPVQTDFSDYRDVGGVKFPFRLTFAWLDGRDAIQLTDIKTNVPIADSKFGPPDGIDAQ